jgi:hypothetical protein
MNLEEKVIQIAQLVEEAETENPCDLFIPILDGFKETPDTNKEHLVAVNGNMLEQFFTDKILDEGETFEGRISEIQNETIESLPNKELYEGESFKFLEDYETELFKFKVYAQDILVGSKEKLYFVRQLNAYFMNPLNNELNLISLAAGRYEVTEDHRLLKDIDNLQEDEIIKPLRKSLEVIMNSTKYYHN